jgi:hypothetical protein
MLKPHADVPRLRKLANSACGIRFVGFVPLVDIATPPKRTFRANPPGQRNWAFQALAIAELLLDAPSSLLLDYMKRAQ